MEIQNRNTRLVTVLLILVLLVSQSESTTSSCVLRGKVYTSLEWYGYLLQKTFQEGESKIQFTISFPADECCANMLIYYDDQIRNLTQDMTCPKREEVLKMASQVIPLNAKNGTVGCSSWEENGRPMVLCAGERTLKSSAPRTWYVAVSRCGSQRHLEMNFMFNMSGSLGECEEDPLSKTYIPPKKQEPDTSHLHVAIAMGVLAGIAIIVAIVFITLYVISRRKIKEKPKNSGSVTSSQATMTQDIFYVNPSLSDREHTDSNYSRSSSENYYEVIPDRRSYESINTQLALHGHGARGLNLAAIPREHRTRIPSYIFEDIPPPPYQPPNLQGGNGAAHGNGTHSHQGSNISSHHSQGSGSGHPLLGTQSPYSGGGLHHIPMTTRFVPISTAPGGMSGPVTMATTTTRIPHSGTGNGHNNNNTASSHQNPSHSSAGNNFNSTSGSSAGNQENQNGGITTSAGGLNSHGANTGPRTMMSESSPSMPVQNGGPIQNGGGTIGRSYPQHNTNHGKLLNHAFRIQQFETTA